MAVLIVVMMMTVLVSPIVSAESAVELDSIIILDDDDLGIQGIAENPEGSRILIYGEDGYAEIIFAQRPEIQIPLSATDKQTMRGADWHPGGGTAFLVGDEGMILRYASDDYSLTQAGEQLNFGQTQLNAVAWNTAGSWAYVGGDDGWLWRIRAQGDGGLETHLIEGRGEGDVTSIDCHDELMLCVISSSTDGIGIIDRDHVLTWIGGNFYPWTSVICPTSYVQYCTSVSSDLQIGMIRLHTEGALQSELSVSDIKGVDGKFMQLSHQEEARSLIIVAPFSLLEHNIETNSTYPWLDNDDAINFDATISGERIIGTWDTGKDSGWIITTRGTMIEFHSTEESRGIGLVLGGIVGFLIPLTIFMLLLTLVYTASPKMQHWMTMKFGNEQEKIDAKRKVRRKR
ncbi:hypothetical protein OAI00_02610 [Euryarchaeota archaeon]|nr:hypothetical protein [Euryarchaeota archaeon]MDC3247115.1 hypothetical protein [Euryarchaeota archaeon]